MDSSVCISHRALVLISLSLPLLLLPATLAAASGAAAADQQQQQQQSHSQQQPQQPTQQPQHNQQQQQSQPILQDSTAQPLPSQDNNHTLSKGISKRSFSGLGCLGIYDKAVFARLDGVCEECYQLYREPDIQMTCRQECFRNDVFTGCVDALLLTNEKAKLKEMVDQLYGR